MLYQLSRSWYDTHLEVCIRVKENQDIDFINRLKADSEKQLRVGNVFIADIRSFADIRRNFEQSSMSELRNYVSGMVFLLLNIFLGLLGTFWFRTEYRKGEMGLRMALGSTRRQLNSIMVGEGVLLLVLAFIPSLVISFNIAHMDLIDTYQLPFTWLRFAICGGITFVLIVLMIICGVWYPARSTARLEPAEALHYE